MQSVEAATEISAASRRFLRLFAANDVAGVASCYTQDAKMLPANMQAIRGRAQIESAFKFTGGRGHTLEFESHELDLLGGTAIEIGAYTRRAADGATLDRGNFMVVWKRVSGEWKIHRDMFASTLARA